VISPNRVSVIPDSIGREINMAMTPTFSGENAFANPKAISSFVRRFFETVREWRRRSRSRRELSVLGERDLRDVRLTRCDIMSETGKPFWKE